jgi:hydroxypyruvate reductase
LAIVRAALAAVDPVRLVARAWPSTTAADGAAGVWLIAAGKAAPAMTASAMSLSGDRLKGALVVAPEGTGVGAGIDSIAGGHPVPTPGSERGGRRALALAGRAKANDEVLVLLSGGASALMAVPAEGIRLEDKRSTTDRLLKAGADIHALNTVRKHLSAIKGGWLAAATEASVNALAISDVVGDDPSVIGSGPTVADPSTFADALAVLERFGGVASFPPAVAARISRGARGEVPETPKPGDARLERATTRVIGSRHDAMRGAAEEASRLGYHTHVMSEPVTGFAREASRAHLAAIERLAQSAARPACVVSSGETTVRVTGSGRGGRNQEFALAAAGDLARLGWVAAASVGTDGIDGPTDAAGALIDRDTMVRAARAGLDSPARMLDDNDSYAFFRGVGDLIQTGPTGTNVGDLQIFLLA